MLFFIIIISIWVFTIPLHSRFLELSPFCVENEKQENRIKLQNVVDKINGNKKGGKPYYLSTVLLFLFLGISNSPSPFKEWIIIIC